MISTAEYTAILDDSTLATNARGQKIAEIYNDNDAAKFGYGLFRSDLQARYERHAAKTEELLTQSALEKALNDFQRNMPGGVEDLISGLEALTAKVDANEQAVKDHSTEQDSLRSAFGAVVMAEIKMERDSHAVDATRATLQKLQDTSVTGSIDRVRRGRVSSYARIKDDATRRISHLQDDVPLQEQTARNALNAYLRNGFITAEPLAAPATARFRKPQVQP